MTVSPSVCRSAGPRDTEQCQPTANERKLSLQVHVIKAGPSRAGPRRAGPGRAGRVRCWTDVTAARRGCNYSPVDIDEGRRWTERRSTQQSVLVDASNATDSSVISGLIIVLNRSIRPTTPNDSVAQWRRELLHHRLHFQRCHSDRRVPASAYTELV